MGIESERQRIKKQGAAWGTVFQRRQQRLRKSFENRVGNTFGACAQCSHAPQPALIRQLFHRTDREIEAQEIERRNQIGGWIRCKIENESVSRSRSGKVAVPAIDPDISGRHRPNGDLESESFLRRRRQRRATKSAESAQPREGDW
jgi:hypothetical protein